jgi:hypothetical protein
MAEQDFIRGLREFADFLEAHPEVPAPTYPDLSIFTDRDGLRLAARALPRAEKVGLGDSFFVLRGEFGNIEVQCMAPREQVCRRVVVGTEEVPEKVVPAHTKEVVEWECDEPLLAPPKEVA